jgi:hypothetical protein
VNGSVTLRAYFGVGPQMSTSSTTVTVRRGYGAEVKA